LTLIILTSWIHLCFRSKIKIHQTAWDLPGRIGRITLKNLEKQSLPAFAVPQPNATNMLPRTLPPSKRTQSTSSSFLSASPGTPGTFQTWNLSSQKCVGCCHSRPLQSGLIDDWLIFGD
jgi:hypothetical protein